ncbi:ABC transporter permease, partial [Pseudomonas syringae]
MLPRATAFLGADLILEGASPARAEQVEEGKRLQLKHAQSMVFSSVIATDAGIQLSSIKAGDDAYPLRGELKSAADLYQPEQAGSGPQPGEAWVEARLPPAADLKVGRGLV